MNAEALIGTVLGTCTLQKLIGQGGMGAVFLAQQSRPRRQVAVKVLLPMTPLSPNQLAAFLERFRRETDAAASLEHPNITPVHEYGERDGLAYLVMPYMSGGTLRDEMEREGPLPLAKTVNYLDQMAAALDFAHQHGVIHRDIKPANILMTPEGRLLLTDFGLVKIVSEGGMPQIRLTGAGAPVGTPDYMAPEQVIGEEVDARADLYSLGVILYQMVTGTTPFQGETPMQIAAQHLQIPPPSPHILRPDLPMVAEQVLLRAMAKRPSDRYASAQELANAFRMALVGTGIPLGMGDIMQATGMLNRVNKLSPQTAGFPVAGNAPQPRGLLSRHSPAADAGNYLTGQSPAVGGGGLLSRHSPVANEGNYLTGQSPAVGGGGLLSRTGMLSSIANPSPAPNMEQPQAGGLLSRTGKFPMMGNTGYTQAVTGAAPVAFGATPDASTLFTSPAFSVQPGVMPLTAGQSSVLATTSSQSAIMNTTGSLTVPGQPGSNTVKLTGPVKVVQVPVAGQPGRFVTGILPIQPYEQASIGKAQEKKGFKLWAKIMITVLILLMLVGVGGGFWYTRSHPGLLARFGLGSASPQMPTNVGANLGTPNGINNTTGTAANPATATANANTVLYDPLTQDVHNWPVTPSTVYAFKDGAYHITNQNGHGQITILPSSPLDGPLVYTLTMQQIAGDIATPQNSFGMILRFNQHQKGTKTITNFYSFEVENTKGGTYHFWKYDDTNGAGNAWKVLWQGNTGDEYHLGTGAKSSNTFKVVMNGNKFSFVVNGKTVSTFQDGSFTTGTVGMIVNQNNTEVAFKDLYLTRQ
jgi:serine/threonine protein kinase